MALLVAQASSLGARTGKMPVPPRTFRSLAGCALQTFIRHRRDACATEFSIIFHGRGLNQIATA